MIAEKIAPLRLAVQRRRAAAGQPARSRRSTSSTSSGATSASSTSRGGWRRAASGCGSSPSTPSARCRRAGGATSRPTAGSTGMLDEVEVVFGRESQGIEMSRGDALIATTWWTAHIANAALRSLDAERFLYLIQEYEPFTFPMGTLRGAGGRELHASPTPRCSRPSCCATTSAATRSASTRRRGGGRRRLGRRSTTRSPPSTRRAPPSWPAGRPRRLLFYARPEPHAARNMFEVGVLALSRARGARRVRRRLGAARHRLGARRPPARPRRRRADGAPPARGAGGLRRLHARATTSASR